MTAIQRQDLFTEISALLTLKSCFDIWPVPDVERKKHGILQQETDRQPRDWQSISNWFMPPTPVHLNSNTQFPEKTLNTEPQQKIILN